MRTMEKRRKIGIQIREIRTINHIVPLVSILLGEGGYGTSPPTAARCRFKRRELL